MGEFTNNLLKLTEFPFSYSLISLLALLLGNTDKVKDFSFNDIGPLFVLMGFVATTISICDPIGSIWREHLRRGFNIDLGYKLVFPAKIKRVYRIHSIDLEKLLESKVFGMYVTQIFPPPYLIAVRFSPDAIRKIGLNWDKLFADISDFESEFEKLGSTELEKILDKLYQLGFRSIRSKWISAEIDKITALIYFIIVITVFIFAIFLVPYILNNFVKAFNNNEWARWGIGVFAFSSLAGIFIILLIKIEGLQSKTNIVFKYLTALETIRTNGKDFKATLDNIEGYMDSNDWILAGYWLSRTMDEYEKVYLSEIRRV